MKAVIIAAGYGTRFLPCSKTIPKEMFPFIDTPAIDLIIDEFVNTGIKDILIVTSRPKKVFTPSIFEFVKKNERNSFNINMLTNSKIDKPNTFRYTCKYESDRIDIGDKYGYIEAIIKYGLERDDLKDQVEKIILKYYQKKN